MEAPSPSSRDEFNAQIQYLESLGYRERRYTLWHQNTPRLSRYIYKFRAFDAVDPTSIERVRDILIQSRLRLASPKDFNDPFDMAAKIVIEGTRGEIRQRLDTVYKDRGMKWAVRQREIARVMLNLNEGVVSKAQEWFRDRINAAGICSFGGNPRSILMWSHYADHHRGVCLQFEIARNLGIFALAFPVAYSEEYPVLNWVNEQEKIVDVLLRKFIGWKYEEEQRIIIPELAGKFIGFRSVALTGIIIGCSASNETVDRLNEIIGERISQGLAAPKLYRAFKDDGKFRLIIKREKTALG